MTKKRFILAFSLGAVVLATCVYLGWFVYTLADGRLSSPQTLHHFVARGETEEVESILRWHPRLAEAIDAPFSQRRALHIACNCGQLKSVEVLIRHGVDLESRDSWGRTPLHTAAAKANAPIVRLLIENGADPTAKDDRGRLPLHSAAWASDGLKSLWRRDPPDAQFEGTVDTVRALLADGSDPSVADTAGCTPLHAAACLGNSAVVEYLVSRRANVNSAYQLKSRTSTPLSEAVNGNHVKIARFLKTKGATLDFVSAAALGEEEYVRNKVREADKGNRYRALVAACQTGQSHIVSLLLEDGVPVHGFDSFNHSFSALHHAARCNQIESARLLILHGADINARNNFGNGPLYEAVYHGHLQMVRFLAESGADINQGNKHGETVLLYAASPAEEDLEMLELLLKLGADPNVNVGGTTPLRRAQNRTQIEKILVRYGAK